MESTTTFPRERVRQIPGFVEGSLVALVQRRAAEAALLRDRRLELAVDRSGHAHVRMVDGVPPLKVATALRLVG